MMYLTTIPKSYLHNISTDLLHYRLYLQLCMGYKNVKRNYPHLTFESHLTIKTVHNWHLKANKPFSATTKFIIKANQHCSPYNKVHNKANKIDTILKWALTKFTTNLTLP